MNEHLLTQQASEILKNTVEVRGELPDKLRHRIEREIAHGQDVQRWVLSLNPEASPELLTAGLLHDIERVVNLEQDQGFQGDRSSSAYDDYKKQHATRSAAYVTEQLALLGVPALQIIRIALLIAHHDDTGYEVTLINDPDLNTLVAADSFSFFTSVAGDFLRREGIARLIDKLYFMVEKMPVALRELLSQQNFTDDKFGLDPEIATVVEAVKQEVLSKFSGNEANSKPN